MSNFPSLDSSPASSHEKQVAEVPIHNIVGLENLCREHSICRLTFFKAAWALLLRVYLGSNSVSFGHFESKENEGLTWDASAAVQAFEIEFTDSSILLEVLLEVEAKHTSLAKLSVTPSPFGGSQPHKNALSFNTALQYQEIETLEQTLGSNVDLKDDRSEGQSNDLEIFVDIRITQYLASIHLYHAASKLSPIAAMNVANTFAEIINSMASKLSEPIHKLQVFTSRDLEQVRKWNTGFPERNDACIHDLVLKHVQSKPDSPALCGWDGNLTYNELDRASALLACHLITCGVASEALVPVCFEKSIFTVVAMLAILRAGGTFVPLDPLHPLERLNDIIDKTKAKTVVASPKTAHLFARMALSTITVSQDFLDSLPTSLDALSAKVRSYNSAFVLFTSGSTGSPKGIVQEHASVCTSSLAHGRAMNVTSESRVLQYAAYTFDVSMMDIFTTLIYGGCVCVPSDEDRMNNIVGTINTMQVNWVLFTPSVANLFVPADVPSLKTLVLGGEAVTQENIRRWAGDIQLFNCYGPAECGACAISLINSQSSKAAVIGRAFGSSLCWVVDPNDHDKLVPIGAVGELLVEGPTLARSYLNDMAKTKLVFIKNPKWPQVLAGNQTRRIYKTGDLVRYNSDGSLDFLGRKDLQVKVRGQRVELGDVEHHLSIYPGVVLSMAASPQAGGYAKTLVAIIQIQKAQAGTLSLLDKSDFDETSFNLTELALFVKSKLPPYMVPNHWLVVQKLPLSVSGKIDRKIVDKWLVGLTRHEGYQEAEGGSSEIMSFKEETIAWQIWKKVTSMMYPDNAQVPEAFRNQDFLLRSAGLDSIQIISLITFIKGKFGVKVQMASLLDPKATIRSLSKSLEICQAQGLDPEAGKSINIMAELQSYRKKLPSGSGRGPSIQTVLLTGATGFLGSQILFQLCARVDIRKIVVHVRAKSAKHGLQRVKNTAMSAGWWSDEYVIKIEVWTGDLAKPRIGLSQDQWNRLSGNVPRPQRVDAIIHNGATVHWNTDFSSLRAANVESTFELLKVLDEAPSILKFVYVSGGYHATLEKQRNMQDIILSTAYAQTKFLSQMLVQEYSQQNLYSKSRVSIVKPSYIIGTAQEGIANTDDFIWRLVASCIQIGSYNEAEADGWLFVSDVGHVASRIVNCCDTNDSSTSFLDIMDGLLVRDFWSILREFGYKLVPKKPSAWSSDLQVDIDARQEAHPLWPLLPTLEKGGSMIGVEIPPGALLPADSNSVKVAIRRNVEYLHEIGFLLKPEEPRKIRKEKAAGFTRSRRIDVFV